MFDHHTNKILAIYAMSRVCAKCNINNNYLTMLCLNNFTSSSKVMKAHSAVTNIRKIFNINKCYVHIIDIDNNGGS